MKLGLELLADHPVTLRLGTFVETWLAAPTGTVRRSLGRDEYHLAITIGTGRRLAATGRTHICQLDLEAADMGVNQARPALLVQAEADGGTPLVWGIRTNLFLDLPGLLTGTTGRLTRADLEPVEFRLDHPLAVAAEVAPGRYVIDITGILELSAPA